MRIGYLKIKGKKKTTKIRSNNLILKHNFKKINSKKETSNKKTRVNPGSLY
jgi:hypothetical protein